MAVLPAYLFPLLALALLLLALAWLSYQLASQIYTIAFRLTDSADIAVVAYFLIFLPGVLVHEGAHWIVARLLGLKTSKFRVWPSRSGRSIGLGSVNVQSGGVFVDSLVGLAPLVVGTLLIALIASQVFAAQSVFFALERGQWRAGLTAFVDGLQQSDGALWAYLIFTIANVMMPSPSDREPVKPVLLYLGLASLIYVVLGLPLDPLASTLEWLTPTLGVLNSALLFTVLLDGVVWVFLNLALLVVKPR